MIASDPAGRELDHITCKCYLAWPGVRAPGAAAAADSLPDCEGPPARVCRPFFTSILAKDGLSRFQTQYGRTWQAKSPSSPWCHWAVETRTGSGWEIGKNGATQERKLDSARRIAGPLAPPMIISPAAEEPTNMGCSCRSHLIRAGLHARTRSWPQPDCPPADLSVAVQRTGCKVPPAVLCRQCTHCALSGVGVFLGRPLHRPSRSWCCGVVARPVAIGHGFSRSRHAGRTDASCELHGDIASDQSRWQTA